MKAAIIERPQVLTVKNIPEPPMGEYDALCELLYGATCSGTDMHLLNGRFPWPVNYPTVLGHESIGRVVKVGAKVRHFQVGDLVTRVGTLPVAGYDINWGGFAELGIARDHRAAQEDGLPASEWAGYRVNQRIPAGIDPAAATMMITWRETFSYLTRMGFSAGASLLVIGSGGNGLAFANHAANLGASRVGMIGSGEREATARAVGVTDFADYHRPEAMQGLKDAVPDGFDYVLDVVGKSGLLDAGLGYLRNGGAVSIYGLDEFGTCQLNPLNARGTFTYASYGYDEAETHEPIVDFILAGKLNAAHWLNLDTPYPLDDITAAFDGVKARTVVKAVVRLKEG